MKKLIVLAASRLVPGRSLMKITRRCAVASLLVIAVAFVLGVPGPASAHNTSRSVKRQVKLYPTADSPLPHATGTGIEWGYWPGPLNDGVGVSVSKMGPNASYYMPVTVTSAWGSSVDNILIQTDARGNGEGAFYGYPDYKVFSSFQVYDSSGILVLTSSR